MWLEFAAVNFYVNLLGMFDSIQQLSKTVDSLNHRFKVEGVMLMYGYIQGKYSMKTKDN